MPLPAGISRMRLIRLPNLISGHRPNLFHYSHIILWRMSIPRSARRSSTLRSESGYWRYVVITRWDHFGQAIKVREGIFHPATVARTDAWQFLGSPDGLSEVDREGRLFLNPFGLEVWLMTTSRNALMRRCRCDPSVGLFACEAPSIRIQQQDPECGPGYICPDYRSWRRSVRLDR
jgi:hypothetical protein